MNEGIETTNYIKQKNINQNKKFKLFKNYQLLLMTLPGILFIFIFQYLPMFGVVLAFKNYNYTDGILGSPWAGLKNFEFFFTSDDAWRVTRNTVLMNSAMIAANLFAAVTIALIFNHLRNKTFKKVAQSVMIFPNFISWVIAGFFAYSLFDPNYGFLNSVIKTLGMDAVYWYEKPELWPAILIIASIWKSAGYGSVVYIAAIAGIPDDVFEAASLDGASSFQQATKIVIPSIMPLMVMLTLLSIGKIFNADFGLFYNVTLDTPTLYPTTDVIDTYVFRALRTGGDIGMTAAVGLYQAIVGFVLVLASNLLVKLKNPENSLF